MTQRLCGRVGVGFHSLVQAGCSIAGKAAGGSMGVHGHWGGGVKGGGHHEVGRAGVGHFGCLLWREYGM